MSSKRSEDRRGRIPAALLAGLFVFLAAVVVVSSAVSTQDGTALLGGGDAIEPSGDETPVRRGTGTDKAFVEVPRMPGPKQPEPEEAPEPKEPPAPAEVPGTDPEVKDPPPGKETGDPDDVDPDNPDTDNPDDGGRRPADASPPPIDDTGERIPDTKTPSDDKTPDSDRPTPTPTPSLTPTPTPTVDETLSPTPEETDENPDDTGDPPAGPDDPDEDAGAPDGDPDDAAPGLEQEGEGLLPILDQPGSVFASGFEGEPSPRTELVSSVRDPTELSFSLAHLVEAIVLTGMLILLIGFPAELFNATLLENYEEISGWFNWSWLRRLRAWVAGLHGAVVAVAFAGAGALIHALLEHDLHFDKGSFALVLGLFLTFVAIALIYDVMRKLHLHRRHELPSRLRAQMIGMVVAVIFVAMSRVGDFHPGYMYGLFTALAFGWDLHPSHHGRALALASVRLFAIAVAAWFLWIPVKHMAEQPDASFFVLTVDAMLSLLWVAGIAAIVFGLAPIHFFYGEAVKKWSFWGWAAIWVPGAFMFVYTLLHPERGLYGSSSEASLFSVMLLFIGFGLFSVAFWGFFRVRDLRRKPAGAHAA